MKVICGISGGVDSAVAALLLKNRGFNVIGAFMKNWDVRDETGYCSTDQDLHYAEKVCKSLKIPFYQVDFVKDYWTNVFTETLGEYESGRTPNPDVLCNKYVKFDAFHKYAMNRHNTNIIATGHYARTSENFRPVTSYCRPNSSDPASSSIRNNGKLYNAIDEGKDQTFFLNHISSNVVRHTIFPLGNLFKRSVKDIAFLNGLSFVSKRKESMGICFIGLRDFPQFIVDYIPPKTGKYICIETKEILGEHDGYFKLTVGQRAPISVKSTAYFVVGKNSKTGNVYLAPDTLHHSLFSSSFVTDPLHWIDKPNKTFIDSGSMKCGVRVMHREPIVDCDIYSIDKNRCLFVLKRPLRAITPGQSAVLYFDNECLGGTRILNIGPSLYECYFGFPQLGDHRDDQFLWVKLYNEHGYKIIPSGKNLEQNIANYNMNLDNYRKAISR